LLPEAVVHLILRIVLVVLEGGPQAVMDYVSLQTIRAFAVREEHRVQVVPLA
jgi:hypothetical protein